MIMKNQLLNLKMIALMCLMMVLGGANVWAQASLPVSYNGGKTSLPKGFTQSGLERDYDNAPKFKFKDAGSYLLLQIDSDPGEFSCLVKQNGTATSLQFDIQYSIDGKTFTTFKTIKAVKQGNITNVTYDFSNLTGVRYIKWIYTTKGSSTNIALGSISVKEKAKAVQSIAFSGTPTKNIYNEGELFDPAGIKVMALYEGETDQVDVTSKATLDYDKTPLAVGTTQMEVKASFKEKVATQTFDITVNELPKYDITAFAAVGGSYTVKIGDGDEVSVPAEGATYKSIEGKKVVMTIAAADGYKLQSTPFDVETDDNKTVSVSKSGTSYSFTMPAKAVTITAKFSKLYNITKGVCEHGTITIENSNTEVSQAVKGNKIVVTATPDEHYDLSGLYYVVSGSDEHISISGNSFTMPENDVTVYATFAEKAKYQVTWMTNGTEAKKELIYSDATIGSEAPEAAKVEGYSFMGWTTTALAEATDVAPVYVSLTDNKFMPEADVTLYAVYAVVAEGGTKECTSTVSLNSADLSSVYENEGAKWTFEKVSSTGVKTAGKVFVTLPLGSKAKTLTIVKGSSWSSKIKLELIDKNDVVLTTITSNTAEDFSFDNVNNSTDAFSLVRTDNATNVAWIKTISIVFEASTYKGYCTTIGTATKPTYTAQTPVTFRAEDNGDYYATFSNDKVTFIISDYSEAYKIVVSDGNIVKTKFDAVAADINGETVNGYFIPANTGVLLYSIAKTADYYTVENKTVDAISPADNMLMPAPANGGVFEATPGYKYYKLAYDDFDNQKGLGFYWGAPEGGKFFVKAGTAYLAVSVGEATAKGFAFNGEATGIEGVNANVENAKAIYNLNGQRVASMAKPGLYIVNGKKMVVRK